ncbi:unnamed protein product [Dracunculus medinensis]|uniref:Transposase n=1 Tax=Dracunculus medinensis TaxID=318479 RepID=A0A0N4UN13_DRAME|nr:unnamed protein product [Dracunculus medinensis]VDN60660.1 unnamed protein product [Dracunculus medinensis]
MVIIGVDRNERVGHGAATIKSASDMEIQCANGERLLLFAEEQEEQLFVTNAYFRRRKRHLITYSSPYNQHFNQIDYVLSATGRVS